MISGPVVVQVLEGENAVARNREVMGATNPANAADGTIRAQFAESIEANSVHGSDSAENAAQEIGVLLRGDRDRRLTRPQACRSAPRGTPGRRVLISRRTNTRTVSATPANSTCTAGRAP